MKYFIIAGEASGDLHAANLTAALLKKDTTAEVRAWGGDQLRSKGATVTKDYSELAIMGFVEIIKKIPQIKKNFNQALSEINDFKPDALILVDFSGFNLRLAKKVKKAGFTGKIFYYISPKLWVWNSKRVEKIKAYIDAMFCILPFEVDWYKQHGYQKAHYIGNPLMDEVAAFKPEEDFKWNNSLEKPIITLLPGSRSNEINQILPEMLKIVPDFPDYQFVIAGVRAMENLIQKHLKHAEMSVPIFYGETYNLIHHADAALVTSGTATLEAALIGTPLILCYKGSAISFAIAKTVVNIDYIGLPNLILKKEMVKELIQKDLTKQNITAELNALLHNEERRNEFFTDQKQLAEKVGEAGASKKAAEIMVSIL